jgi:hypothetical protein
MTSRQECIDSWGIPASTTRIPVLALIMGPIVLPHGQSLRTTNSLTGTSEMRPSSRTMNPVIPFVAYLEMFNPMQSNQYNKKNCVRDNNKKAEKTRKVVRDWFVHDNIDPDAIQQHNTKTKPHTRQIKRTADWN